MEGHALEQLLRGVRRPFDRLTILDWYDGILSAVGLLEQEQVALLLEATWADQAFPEKDTYLYSVSMVPYVDALLLTATPVNDHDEARLAEFLAQAAPQDFLVQIDSGGGIVSVWRPVEPGTGTP